VNLSKPGSAVARAAWRGCPLPGGSAMRGDERRGSGAELCREKGRGGSRRFLRVGGCSQCTHSSERAREGLGTAWLCLGAARSSLVPVPMAPGSSSSPGGSVSSLPGIRLPDPGAGKSLPALLLAVRLQPGLPFPGTSGTSRLGVPRLGVLHPSQSPSALAASLEGTEGPEWVPRAPHPRGGSRGGRQAPGRLPCLRRLRMGEDFLREPEITPGVVFLGIPNKSGARARAEWSLAALAGRPPLPDFWRPAGSQRPPVPSAGRWKEATP